MQTALKILLMSRYDTLGASSRVRSYQYLPLLSESGIEVKVSPLFSNAYLHALYNKDPNWSEVIKGYVRRVLTLFSAYKYDLIYIEKELFPFLPAFFERLLSFVGIPYLVDYDDALFHRYDKHKLRSVRTLFGKKIDTVMEKASVVVAGNSYLAERAERAGAKKIVILPTVVDTKHYSPAVGGRSQNEITVGWIGTPKTSHYLLPLLPVFKTLQTRFELKFVAIGANPEDFHDTPIEVWPWSQDSEVASIQKLDIGIMPLDDSPWERGKCGYKLIQYMACGLPVIASPVGVNDYIVKDGVNGFLAATEKAWETRLSELAASLDMRSSMGHAARQSVEQWYSLDIQQERLLAAIYSAAGRA